MTAAHHHPKRQTHALRRGRVSIPHARYFITITTAQRRKGLAEPAVAAQIIDTIRAQHRDRDYELMMATIMPDHLHLLFTLGTQLDLSRVIGKFKSTSPLPSKGPGLHWQQNFYDHRLRGDDALEPFSRYIFLNPYRAKSIPLNQEWPWFVRNRHHRPEFLDALNEEKFPQAEWVQQSRSIRDLVEAENGNVPDAAFHS